MIVRPPGPTRVRGAWAWAAALARARFCPMLGSADENPMDSICRALPADPTTASMIAPDFEMSRKVAVTVLSAS